LMLPFRATDPDAAAHLMSQACRAGMADEVELEIVDLPIADALRAAGAHVRDRMFEMGGAL